MRHARPRLAVALFATGLALPALAAPCAGFTDVDDADPFCTSVAWMKNRGITLGCTATLYCPGDFVTRLQMAAFMYRLGHQNAFLQGGNAFGASAVLGTTDAHAVEVRAGGLRAFRLEPDAASPNVIGGSPANAANPSVRGVVIGGGGAAPGADPWLNLEQPNRAHDHYATVAGGMDNRAGSDDGDPTNDWAAAVGGGHGNVASGGQSVVAGGWGNVASGSSAAVGGGAGNDATASTATVAGGSNNLASGDYASVGGGLQNVAAGESSTVAGGRSNRADGHYATVPGGQANRATGFNSVAMGAGSEAIGSNSFALGRNAEAGSNGCFVFADSSSVDPTQCGVANAFVARAKGGFYLITGGSYPSYSGAYLAPGSPTWTTFSDRDGKDNVVGVDAAAVLARVVSLPIATWNWKAQDASIRHMGPMAQDFRAAFGLGASPHGIDAVDADGVALAAIQGLNAKLEAALARRDAEIAALRAEVDALRRAATR